MSKENHIQDDDDIEGYMKIDRYNPELIDNLSEHYKGVFLHSVKLYETENNSAEYFGD